MWTDYVADDVAPSVGNSLAITAHSELRTIGGCNA
jgi:hypothetical protein